MPNFSFQVLALLLIRLWWFRSSDICHKNSSSQFLFSLAWAF